jgi:hypothetical protein
MDRMTTLTLFLGKINVARSNIKVFDMNTVPIGGYHYFTGGLTPTYALRNEVGFAFDQNNMFLAIIGSLEDLC